MFKLLSKESNIFSIPVYIGFLLLMIMSFNILNFNILEAISAGIVFFGVALGYFVFGQINLNRQTHTPLFLYTFFIFAFYPENMDIGVAVSLFTNSFLLLILTSTNEVLRRKSYLLVGSILAINYIFLPTTWAMFLFVLLHIIATSNRIFLNIFRFLYGIGIVLFAYFCISFFLGNTQFNAEYLPIPSEMFTTDFYPLEFLIPILLLVIYAIIDHFNHYNEKSPDSRYKYTFLLTFVLAQAITIGLYMGQNYQYLLLLALPLSIILSRALRFFPKYWFKELGLWLIILCLVIFKFLLFNSTSLNLSF